MKFSFMNIVLIVAIVFLCISFIAKTYINYTYNHSNWEIVRANHGFAIVTNEDSEILVRNPVGPLEPGDDIILKGINYSELPYIYSEK